MFGNVIPNRTMKPQFDPAATAPPAPSHQRQIRLIALLGLLPDSTILKFIFVGKNVSRSTQCPCGSGKIYKLCCGMNTRIITPQSLNSNTQKAIAETKDAETSATKDLRICCWPSCNSENAIRAHTISESYLRRVSENGHVLHFRHLIDDIRSRSARDGKPKLVGIKKASTFYGFCDSHDKNFIPIDGQWIENGENFFLHAYRITSYNYFRAKLNQRRAIESQGEATLRATPSPDFVDDRISNNMLGYLAVDLVNNSIAKQQLELIHINKNYSELESYICYFDDKPTIAAAMTFPCFIYFDGRRQSVSIYEIAETPQVHLALVPLKVGGVLIVTWHKNVSHFARVQWETFDQIPNKSKSDVLLRMLFHWSGGTVLSPAWWNSLTPQKKKYLERIVKNYTKFSKNDQISTDLINANGKYNTNVVDWAAKSGFFCNTVI